MKKLVTAPHGLHGSLTVPGDKSISHRAVMLGSISKGKTVIHHFLAGDDCLSTLAAFNAMGVKSERDGETVIIYGNGIDALKEPAQPLDMGNSGTTTRLLMGILAGRDFETRLFGDASLQKRPMKRVSEPLSHLGARIELTDNGTLPATIHGQKLHGTHYQMQVASAQVKSALIFAALQADTPSTIIEKLPTRNHTEIMLNQFGANIETATDQKTIRIVPKPELTGQTVEVPGDISSAAFFLTAGAIVANSRIRLERVNLNPTRTGIITVLQKMGADLQIEALPTDGEPLGNITIATSQLKPIQIEAEDIPAVIDELPLVALLAACADGTSSIRGAEELRVKETDRIQTVVAELRKLGVQVEELTDGMIIKGRSQWAINDDQLDSYGDHRIGMMDAIAALKADRPLQLAHADAGSQRFLPWILPGSRTAVGRRPGMTTVFVKGLGLIGSTLIRAIRQKHPKYRIVGSDISTATLDFAIEQGLIDDAGTNLYQADQADFIILAGPVSAIVKDLHDLARLELKPGVIITDVGSTKQTIIDAAQPLIERGDIFIGGHPMAGSHESGIQAGRVDLFKDAYYFLIPTSGSKGVSELKDLLSGLNVNWYLIHARQHDKIVAQLSHVPHVIATALMTQSAATFKDHRELLKLAAGGFKSTTRIAKSDPTMWSAIMHNNRELIVQQLDEYLNELQSLRQAIAADDQEKLFAVFSKAKAEREKLDH